MIKSRLKRNIGVAVVAVPMLLFGASSFNTSSGENVALRIGDNILSTQQFNQDIERNIEDYVGQYGPAARESSLLRRQVEQNILVDYIQRFIAIERIGELGLTPVDAEIEEAIRADASFNVDGKFSNTRFQSLVGNPRLYLEQLSQDLAAERFNDVFVTSEILSESLVEPFAKFIEEKRIVKKGVFKFNFDAEYDFSDVEKEAHYDETKTNYIDQKQAKYEYILIESSDYEDQVVIDEDQLREAHEERASASSGNAERKLSLILTETEEEAQQLLTQARAGNDFATLALENSIDTGSSEAGGDIGFLTQEDLQSDVAEQVFAVDVGEIVGPVGIEGEWGLFKVTGLIGGRTLSFNEIKDDLLKDLRAEQLLEFVEADANTIRDIAFEDENELDRAAQSIGRELLQTDWIQVGQEDLTYPFDTLEVLIEVLSDDFIEEGQNSDIFTLENGSYLIARAIEYKPEKQLDFDEVKDQVVKDMTRNASIRDLVTDLKEDIVKVKNGEYVERLDFSELPAIELGLFDISSEVNAVQREDLFAYVPTEEEKAPIFVNVADLPNNEYIIYQIEQIIQGEADEAVVGQYGALEEAFTTRMLLLGHLSQLEQFFTIVIPTNSQNSSNERS